MKRFFLVLICMTMFLQTLSAMKDIDSQFESFVDFKKDQSVAGITEQSCLELSAAMLTKGKRCCAPSANSCALEVFVNGSNVTPFLPTGPITPITANFFYAYRQVGVTTLVANLPVNIPFSGVGATDGNWVWDGAANFTAQVSGVYLVSITIPYQYDLSEPAVSLFLEPTLDGSVIDFTVSSFLDASASDSLIFSFQLRATFIVTVSEGQILRVQDRITNPTGQIYRIGVPSNVTTNGSISIVRIR